MLDLLPLLNKGFTTAYLRRSGKTPLWIDVSQMWQRGLLIIELHIFSIFVEIPSYPPEFLLSCLCYNLPAI